MTIRDEIKSAVREVMASRSIRNVLIFSAGGLWAAGLVSVMGNRPLEIEIIKPGENRPTLAVLRGNYAATTVLVQDPQNSSKYLFFSDYFDRLGTNVSEFQKEWERVIGHPSRYDAEPTITK